MTNPTLSHPTAIPHLLWTTSCQILPTYPTHRPRRYTVMGGDSHEQEDESKQWSAVSIPTSSPRGTQRGQGLGTGRGQIGVVADVTILRQKPCSIRTQVNSRNSSTFQCLPTIYIPHFSFHLSFYPSSYLSSPTWPRGDIKPLIGSVVHRVLSQPRVGGCQDQIQQRGDESSSEETSLSPSLKDVSVSPSRRT